jgi:hypothetical protein
MRNKREKRSKSTQGARAFCRRKPSVSVAFKAWF